MCCWQGGLLCLWLGGEQVRRLCCDEHNIVIVVLHSPQPAMLPLAMPAAMLCLGLPRWLLLLAATAAAAAAAGAEVIWLEGHVLLLALLLLLHPVASACAAASAATAAVMARH
jgi:hypothetical protein